MISRIHCIVVAVGDADAAGEAHRRLLGREPEIEDGLGSRRVWFRFPNFALEVLGPTGGGLSGDRVRQRLETHGEGLWLLALQVEDLDQAVQRLHRRGLPLELLPYLRPSAMGDMDGVRLSLLGRRSDPLSPPTGQKTAAVATLDSLRVHTPNPDRALAAYGARLGLELQFDRECPRGRGRQMVFRCGETAIEIAADLAASTADGPDRLDGLAWRVADAEAARARIAAAGFRVSELQAGPEPGARAFTVLDAPAGVRTIMVQSGPPGAGVEPNDAVER